MAVIRPEEPLRVPSSDLETRGSKGPREGRETGGGPDTTTIIRVGGGGGRGRGITAVLLTGIKIIPPLSHCGPDPQVGKISEHLYKARRWQGRLLDEAVAGGVRRDLDELIGAVGVDPPTLGAVSYTHLRAHETGAYL
eukprot:8443208-Pyramimonas_sp.AAC.1